MITMRALLAVLMGVSALGIGAATAVLAASNRARADELDTRQRWCEIVGRQNDLISNRNQERWWLLRREFVQADGPQVQD